MTDKIVDTHQHLWDLSRFSLPWLAGLDALDRSFTLDDYVAAVEGLGVVRSIYMEVDVADDQQQDEVDYVTRLCADSGNCMAAAVVSGRPATEGFAAWVRSLEGNTVIKGVRQVLHVPQATRGTCLQPSFVHGIRLLGEAGLRFDVCLRPGELADAEKLAAACPDTLLVLDHCGIPNPNIVAGVAEPDGGPMSHTAEGWRRSMAALSERSNVVCKISGIAAAAGDTAHLAELLAPTINHCLDVFGPDRVVFGGDWPVCTLGATYAEWVAALRAVIASRPAGEQTRLLHDNAVRLYALE
ncbi:MAG: amidohydrolase family protein [bacterium]|nr:amidohydrolase family protein [bacterium]